MFSGQIHRPARGVGRHETDACTTGGKPRRQTRPILAAFTASLLSGFLGAGTGTAGAEPRQNLSALESAAHDFLQQQYTQSVYPVEIEISRLDERLLLKPCDSGLDSEYASQGARYGRTLVKVTCPQPRWQVYVQAQVEGYADVLVADRALPRGSSISAEAVRIEKQSLSSLRDGYFSDPGEIERLEVRQSLRPGTVLSQRHLAPPRLVRRGDAVLLVVRAGDFNVQMQGKALEDAKRGGNVRVRNNSSGRVVEGRAVAAGIVEIAH